jgi:hypothetical protein
MSGVRLAGAEEGVVSFANLGRDAILVVPCPVAAPSASGHLAAFVRFAPEAQRHAPWGSVGAAMAQPSGTKPVWLSTAGAGVSWQHGGWTIVPSTTDTDRFGNTLAAGKGHIPYNLGRTNRTDAISARSFVATTFRSW